jgi:hypothetical protein
MNLTEWERSRLRDLLGQLISQRLPIFDGCREVAKFSSAFPEGDREEMTVFVAIDSETESTSLREPSEELRTYEDAVRDDVMHAAAALLARLE